MTRDMTSGSDWRHHLLTREPATAWPDGTPRVCGHHTCAAPAAEHYVTRWAPATATDRASTGTLTDWYRCAAHAWPPDAI